jgi:hypothetical protein
VCRLPAYRGLSAEVPYSEIEMRIRLLGSLLSLCTAAGSITASAWAQDPAPAEPAPAEPAPAEAAPPEPAPAAPAASEPVAQAEPAAPAEEESFPPAWFRIDSDFGGLQLWAGATHALGDGIGLATDIYVNSGTLGEFDIGPAITAGPLTITPMLGIQFDWALKKAAAFVPQLYITGGPDPIYLEIWVQNYLYTLFDYPSEAEVAVNTLYFRLFVDYKVGKYFAIGPQAEPLLALSGDGDTLISLPVGGNIMFTNYGAGNSLFFFLGVETQDAGKVDDAALTGRLTFVKNF